MNINVKVKSGKEFEGYLRILASVPPFSLLRPRELQVLAELYAINSANIAIPEETRNKIVFHKDTRQSIADKLGISVQSVYNITLSLREKGLLGDDKFITKFVIPKLDKITFNFTEE